MGEKNFSVCIIDQDEVSRKVLEDFLRGRACGEVVLPEFEVLASVPDGQAGDVLWIGEGAADGVSSLPRPVRVGALLQRLEQMAKREKMLRDEAEFMVGAYRAYPHLRLLKDTDGSVAAELTDKECDILVLLNRMRGTTVTRDILLDEIWGYVEGLETHTLETHIYRLRQKIEDDPSDPKVLVTGEDGYSLAD